VQIFLALFEEKLNKLDQLYISRISGLSGYPVLPDIWHDNLYPTGYEIKGRISGASLNNNQFFPHKFANSSDVLNDDCLFRDKFKSTTTSEAVTRSLQTVDPQARLLLFNCNFFYLSKISMNTVEYNIDTGTRSFMIFLLKEESNQHI
jgi:hypothetical protein